MKPSSISLKNQCRKWLPQIMKINLNPTLKRLEVYMAPSPWCFSHPEKAIKISILKIVKPLPVGSSRKRRRVSDRCETRKNKIQGEVWNVRKHEQHLLLTPIGFLIFFVFNPHPLFQDVCAKIDWVLKTLFLAPIANESPREGPCR